MLRRTSDLPRSQRRLHVDQVENDNTVQQVSLDDSENGYWLLEENSNSDSNLDDSNSNANSNPRRWTSRWIQLDTSSRNSEYANDLPNEQTRSRSSLSEDVDQNSGDRHGDHQSSTTQDRNQLSPVSLNPSRYERPPLFPFRSLRENQSRRVEQNQMLASNSTHNSARFQLQTPGPDVTDEFVDLTENVNDPVAMRIVNETNRESELTGDRLQESQNQGNINMEHDLRTLSHGDVDSREDSPGSRREIQLLSRHIDNMQRLCR